MNPEPEVTHVERVAPDARLIITSNTQGPGDRSYLPKVRALLAEAGIEIAALVTIERVPTDDATIAGYIAQADAKGEPTKDHAPYVVGFPTSLMFPQHRPQGDDIPRVLGAIGQVLEDHLEELGENPRFIALARGWAEDLDGTELQDPAVREAAWADLSDEDRSDVIESLEGLGIPAESWPPETRAWAEAQKAKVDAAVLEEHELNGRPVTDEERLAAYSARIDAARPKLKAILGELGIEYGMVWGADLRMPEDVTVARLEAEGLRILEERPDTGFTTQLFRCGGREDDPESAVLASSFDFGATLLKVMYGAASPDARFIDRLMRGSMLWSLAAVEMTVLRVCQREGLNVIPAALEQRLRDLRRQFGYGGHPGDTLFYPSTSA